MTATQHHRLVYDGDTLGYTTTGDPAAPPLVFVHGWLGSRHDWRHVLPPLSEDYYCVTVELLGHGESDKPPQGDYSILTQSHRVQTVADALGLTRFILCGHSMGGMIALTMAATSASERVTHLINLSGVVNKKSPILEGAVKLAERADFLVGFGFNVARRLALFEWGQRLLGSGIFYKEPPPDFGNVDLPNLLQSGMEAPFYKALEAVVRMDLRPLLHHVTCPVLTVFGRQDRIVPVAQGHWIAQHIEDHRLVILEACGHYVMLEKPAQCLAAMRDFLAGGVNIPNEDRNARTQTHRP